MALLFGQTVGPEVIFAPDPIGHVPRVTPLADGSFILAWQSDTGDLVAKHLILPEVSRQATSCWVFRRLPMRRIGH